VNIQKEFEDLKEIVGTHIENVGVYEFTKEVLAMLGLITLIWFNLRIFFWLYDWGKPSPKSVTQKGE